jgi:two-component system chemotaxis response regulator CheB
MDGLTFLKRLMDQDPLPVVVCSGFAEPGTRLAVRALDAGAVEIALKPRVGPTGQVEDRGLVEIVRAAAQARVHARSGRITRPTPVFSPPAAKVARRASDTPAPVRVAGGDIVVAIGASTGGTEALREVVRALPLDIPGIVVVQHMPEGFTAAFADHLDAVCDLDVREARPGDRVQPGLVLIAHGNRHLRVERRGPHLLVALGDEPPVSRHRPSVDVLFHSVARAAGARAGGVIMTGMGADGADGLLAMKRAGAATIAQDEATSVVFGMPKEAIDRGAADTVLPLPRIAAGIQQRVQALASGRVL